MSRRTATADAGESATVVSSGGSSPRATVPVQNTNIIQVIAEHLPGEYEALKARIAKQESEMSALIAYRAQLEKIAADAGVDLTPPSPQPEQPS